MRFGAGGGKNYINLQNDVQVFKLLFCLLLLLKYLFKNSPSVNNELQPCLWQGLIRKFHLKSDREGCKIDVWAAWSRVQKLYNFIQNNCLRHTSREWPCPSQQASTIVNNTCQTHALPLYQWKVPNEKHSQRENHHAAAAIMQGNPSIEFVLSFNSITYFVMAAVDI